MHSRRLLEICVESVERAVAAEQGGADRIELCGNLALGGITPSEREMMAAVANCSLPIFAMIRPRGGNFIYTDDEFAAMQTAIRLTKQVQVVGVVLGILTEESRVDVPRTRALVEVAKPAPVTFHRAFDECADLSQALEDVIATGCARILTSGGAPSALAGRDRLAELVRNAGRRIGIMPGGGITAANVSAIAQATGAGEFHAALSSVVPAGHATDKFAVEVQALAASLRNSG